MSNSEFDEMISAAINATSYIKRIAGRAQESICRSAERDNVKEAIAMGAALGVACKAFEAVELIIDGN